MGLPPTVGGDGVVKPTGGGYIYFIPPEHNHKIYFCQSHYGLMSGSVMIGYFLSLIQGIYIYEVGVGGGVRVSI